jgi:DNA primase
MSPNDLHDLLHRIGIRGLVRRNNSIMGCCPFHEERRPSWGISIERDYHPHGCFSCHAKGNLLTLLMIIGGFAADRAKKVANIPDYSMPLPMLDRIVKEFVIDKTELYPFILTDPAARYLRRRGIPRVAAEKLEIVHEPKMNRVLFPWYFNNQLFGVTGRTLDPECDVKTLPLYGTRKGRMLYLPTRRITKGRLFLVEGEIDAMKTYLALNEQVGATGFGNFTDEQSRLIIESKCSEVVLFFDDDPTGTSMAELAIHKLTGHKRVSQVDWSKVREFRRAYNQRDNEKLDPAALAKIEIKEVAREMILSNVDLPTL